MSWRRSRACRTRLHGRCMPLSTSSDNLHRLIYKTCFGNGMLVWRGKTLLVHLLESYFSGKRVDFSPHTLPLERADSTPFQASVLAALAAAPYGETISYAGLAMAAGHPRACRAVGNLMAANPYP